MFGLSWFTLLAVLWGAVTVVLVFLLIYRSLISMKEEDQLFLDPAEAGLEEEQKRILARLNQLTPYTTGLTVASVVLLIAAGSIWVYEALSAPPIR